MKKKLLLADDSITIQKVVGIIFAPENYDLLIASDGDKAYEMALSQQPDLVIADIAMPGKNGFELCREIKSNPALGQTSVLLLPGAFEVFDEPRAVDVCADGWLTKPFESQALLDKVASLCEMPPLRLVPAENAPVEADAENPAAAVEPSEEERMDVEEVENLLAEDEPVEFESEAVEDDAGLWGEVSFEKDDLTPQDVLAAENRDNEEVWVDETQDEDFVAEPSAGQTSEPFASYAASRDEDVAPTMIDAPAFEPLPAEEAPEAREDQEFEFISAQEQKQEQEPEDSEPSAPWLGAEEQLDEETQTFVDVAAPEAVYTLEEDEDPQEVEEWMEEDLDHQEELVEDSDTFIELTDTDEAEAREDSDTGTIAEPADQEEVLDLNECDVVADEYAAAPADQDDDAGVNETVFATAPADQQEMDTHPVAPDAPESAEREEEPMAEIEEGRRDDDLFDDDDEQEGVFHLDDVADEDAADAPVVPPPATVGFVAADMEQQLRQLPEEELKEIVEKVAGPMIAALAREMLEQTIWEVVPDLAETMISAEIDKIKRGEL